MAAGFRADTGAREWRQGRTHVTLRLHVRRVAAVAQSGLIARDLRAIGVWVLCVAGTPQRESRACVDHVLDITMARFHHGRRRQSRASGGW